MPQQIREMYLGTEPSEGTMAQLKVGTVGYLVGTVAWSLFWLGFARNYLGMWVSFLGFIPFFPFFAVSISFVMVGVGCFALSKLFSNWPAMVTGVVDVIAAVPFFIVGLFYLLPHPPWPFRSWHLQYISLIGNGLVIVSLFLWMGLTASGDVSSNFRRLRTAIGIASLVSLILFLFVLPYLGWISFGLTIISQFYVLAQVLSAVLLHKIGSDISKNTLH